MDNIQAILTKVQSAIEEDNNEISILTVERDTLAEQVEVLVEALNESYREIDRLLEADSPKSGDDELVAICEEDTCETISISDINDELQLARNDCEESPQVTAVPLRSTIDSIIAGTLMKMDQGKPVRFSVDDLNKFAHLKRSFK